MTPPPPAEGQKQDRNRHSDSGLNLAWYTGIDAGQLHRFVHGEAWLGRVAIDALAELLNLRIVST